MRARAWCAAWLWGLASSATSCRDITICADARLCAVSGGSSAGAGSNGLGAGGQLARGGTTTSGGAPATDRPGGAPGKAGEAGEAGAGGELTCQLPFANCDQTQLNGCESDLSGDPDHCGDCSSQCDGVCARGRCRPPASIGAMQQEMVADFGVIGDSLFFVWGPYDGPFHLSRVDKTGTNARLLAEDLPRFSRLSVASKELFLWGLGENLRRSTLEGVMTDEGFEVSGVASLSNATYAGRGGQLLERSAGTSTWEPSPWFSAAADTVLWPLAVDDRLVVFRITEDEDAPRYEVLLVGDPKAADGGLRTLASGNGLPTRIRGLHEVYWIVQLPNADSPSFELRRHSLDPEARTQLVASARNITNFALDETFAYVTRTLTSSYELLVIPVSSISEKYRFGSHLELIHPESVGDRLWFYDASSKRVGSVDLGFNEFL